MEQMSHSLAAQLYVRSSQPGSIYIFFPPALFPLAWSVSHESSTFSDDDWEIML